MREWIPDKLIGAFVYHNITLQNKNGVYTEGGADEIIRDFVIQLGGEKVKEGFGRLHYQFPQ